MTSPSNDHQHHSWLFSRTGAVTLGALGILGFLVYTGHSAHLLGLVPYLFILACPLMHLFMHGGHHHHHSDQEGENSKSHSDQDGEKGKSHSHGGGCCGHEESGDRNGKAENKPSSNVSQGE